MSDPTQPLRVLICWTDISGYMCACWKALQQDPSIDLRIVAFEPRSSTNTEFGKSMLVGLPIRLVHREKHDEMSRALAEETKTHRPGVVVVSGWFYPPYRDLAKQRHAANQPVVMSADTPWRGTWKQHLSRFVNGPYVRNMAVVMAAGQRTADYMLRLGIDPSRVRCGMYGYDDALFARAADQREQAGNWPRSFLFIGRYVEVKGIAVLLEAYRRYRDSVTSAGDTPWSLECCGKGPFGEQLRAAEGVTDHGFVDPAALPDRLARAGVFVLPSRYEPWGVALAEAMGSGLPAIATSACGAALDLIKDHHNGLLVPPDHAGSLADAMVSMHRAGDRLPAMGRHAQAYALAFGTDAWVRRWSAALHDAAVPSR